MQTFQRWDITAPNAPPFVRGECYFIKSGILLVAYDNWFSPPWNLGSLLGQLKFQLGPSI